MNRWGMLVILACGVVAVGCGGKNGNGVDTVADTGTDEVRADVCQPNCNGKECGDDGCGGTCGACGVGEECSDASTCYCVPKCVGRECGDDMCGGSCGTCSPGVCCIDGHCCCDPTPACLGRQCGPDGCGGSCGACAPGSHCNLEYQCVPDGAPDCAGKECGSDGAGGACGSCPCPTCDPCVNVCNTQTFQCESDCIKDCPWIFGCFDSCPNGDQPCFQNCVNEAFLPAQIAYVNLFKCLDESDSATECGDIVHASSPEFLECLWANHDACLEYYYECFHGDLTCQELHLCMASCPSIPEGENNPCVQDCFANGSVEALKTWGALVDCLNEAGFPNCPESDPDCFFDYMAAACQIELDACFPPGTLTCKEIFDCMDTCAPTDQACFSQCHQSGTKEAQDQFGAIVDCVIAECSEEATPECEDAALKGTCAELYQKCMGE